ncbi:Uma2 family endonuclease [Zavarzinella formosa]|uniref:Uma2 family endonuclease n=1 Tax=Zavarzinella formosa TaxID=360055 RepID=UPI0002E38623|nr:Uma2 family endonuclease [Zavarzinella formosa]
MSVDVLDAPAARKSPGDVFVDTLIGQLPYLSEGHHYLVNRVSWGAYEHLLIQLGVHHRRARVTFDRGELEFMSNTSIHERWKMAIDRMIAAFAEHVQVTADPTGEVTISRLDLQRGIQPDQSYYIQNVAGLVRHRPLNFNIDPVPDLAIEIEYSRTVIDRLPVFAALGIPELWVYDGERFQVLQLTAEGAYQEATASRCFPSMPLQLVVELLAVVSERDIPSVVREFRSRLIG